MPRKKAEQPNDGEHLICNKCETKKPYDGFYRAKVGSSRIKYNDGHMMPCRSCHRELARKREMSPEGIAKRRAHYAKIRTDESLVLATRERTLLNYHANRDRYLEKRRSVFAKMSIADRTRLALLFKIANRKYSSSLHGKAAAANKSSRRRASKLASQNKLTTPEWLDIILAYENLCAYCGVSGKQSMDHVIPLINGGHHSADNVVPACLSCNSKKRAKPVEQFLAELDIDAGAFAIKRLTAMTKVAC